MRFYTKQHNYYCGIDLHAKSMYLCIIDAQGKVLLHKNIKTDRKAFLKAIEKHRDDLIVSVECTFTWYWIADLCADDDVPPDPDLSGNDGSDQHGHLSSPKEIF